MPRKEILEKEIREIEKHYEEMKRYSFARVAVMGMPTCHDIDNMFIFGEVSRLINVSGHYYTMDVAQSLEEHGITVYDLPLVEEGPDMGLNNILEAVKILMEADSDGERVIVHCYCGNNRSRTVIEAFHFAKLGKHLEDEYRGEFNHLLYNSKKGHLPPIEMLENLLTTYNR